MPPEESRYCWCCLKASTMSLDNSMSLNIPSSLLVNPPPHSVNRCLGTNYSRFNNWKVYFRWSARLNSWQNPLTLGKIYDEKKKNPKKRKSLISCSSSLESADKISANKFESTILLSTVLTTIQIFEWLKTSKTVQVFKTKTKAQFFFLINIYILLKSLWLIKIRKLGVLYQTNLYYFFHFPPFFIWSHGAVVGGSTGSGSSVTGFPVASLGSVTLLACCVISHVTFLFGPMSL